MKILTLASNWDVKAKEGRLADELGERDCRRDQGSLRDPNKQTS